MSLRAERVSRPAMEKKRRRRVLVVTSCSPRPMRAVQRASNCLESQWEWVRDLVVEWFQDEPYLSMEVRIISSLRIQAVRASFLGFRQTTDAGVPYDQVEAAGYHRPHVKGFADLGSSTPDGAFGLQGTTVPVEGGHAHQGSDLPAVESSQFGQAGQKSIGDTVSYPGYAAQQVVLLPPYGTLAQGLP